MKKGKAFVTSVKRIPGSGHVFEIEVSGPIGVNRMVFADDELDAVKKTHIRLRKEGWEV